MQFRISEHLISPMLRMTGSVAAVTLTCLALVSPGLSGASAAPAQQNRLAAQTWEVAGVRLGMTDQQAETALRERGYTIGSKELSFNFQERVQMAMGKKLGTGGAAVNGFTATKGQERVELFFVQTAAGTSVSRVWYRVPVGQVSGADAIASMKRRLGPPAANVSSPSHALWCTAAPKPRWCDESAPTVEIGSSPNDDTSIMMKAGTALNRRAEAEIAAAAKASPARIKPSF